jgi:hypothetical protein
MLIDDIFINEYKTAQRQMVADLSVDITIGLEPTEVECPNCRYTRMDDSSIATHRSFVGTVTVFAGTSCERTISSTPFRRTCPVCKGKGKLQCASEVTIPAMVNWDPSRFDSSSDAIPDTPAGLSPQKVIRIKTDIDYWEYIYKAKYYMINDVRFESIQAPYRRGMGGQYGVVVAFLGTTEASHENA